MRKSGEEKREMMGSAMTDNRMAICGCFMIAVPSLIKHNWGPRIGVDSS